MKQTYLAGILIGAFSFCSHVNATPIRDIANLTSVTFWEVTTVSQAYTFEVNSPQLSQRLNTPLGTANMDFGGVIDHEFYDVFYSDVNGAFNVDGEYITIESTYDIGLPKGGGLNLAEIWLNFIGTPTQYGNYIASFVILGDNAIPSSVGLAADGDLNTWTTMGNTIDTANRLRVTFGFISSSAAAMSAPEPTTMLICSMGLAFLSGMKLRMKKYKLNR